ncbi:MAG: GNAT family N-acetyltransferase [Chromatiales bacterium]|jgi:GNAT superfamily N-acetyltransferase|nr:GNAT family N-acetyltransferase [Chromatiales bacterium]
MSNTTWQLRLATTQDVAQITRCVTRAYEHYIERMGKPPGPMLADYAEIVAKHHVTVAQSCGVTGGVVVVMERPEGPLLDNVAVDPDAQGTGLGKRLIDSAESTALRLGASFIDLYTHESMVENVGLYMHLGYQETGRIEEKGYARIYMRKVLST